MSVQADLELTLTLRHFVDASGHILRYERSEMLIGAVTVLLVLHPQAPSAPPPLRFAVRVTNAPGVASALDEDELLRAIALRVRSSGIDVASADAGQPADCLIAITNEAHQVVVWLELATEERVEVGSVRSAGRTSSDLAHTVVLLLMEALEPIFPDIGGVAPPPPVVVPAQPAPPPPPPAAPIGVAVGGWAGATLLWPEHKGAPGGGAMLQVTRQRLVLQSDVAIWAGPRRDGTDYTLHLTNVNLRLAAGIGTMVSSMRVAVTLGPTLRLFVIHASGADIVSPGTRADVALAAQGTARLPLGPVDVVLYGELLGAARAPRFVVDGNTVLDTGRFAAAVGIGLLYRLDE